MTHLVAVGNCVTVTVDSLGFAGDGLARVGKQTLAIPFTCEGETVEATISHIHHKAVTATLNRVLTSSPDRVTPPCKHYTHCGGCQLQHLAPERVAAFKSNKLQLMLARLGVSAEDAARITMPSPNIPLASRRRIEWTVQVAKDGAITMGFHAPSSYQIVATPSCVVAHPQVQALHAPLHALLMQLAQPKRIKRIAVQRFAERVLEVVLHLAKPLSADDAAHCTHFAQEHALARVSLVDEDGTVRHLVNQEPCAVLGGVDVPAPAGAFLQAAEEGQAALTDFVLAHTVGAARVVDLYCGMGTYTLPLAVRGANVTAFEGYSPAIEALQTAARRASLEHRVDARVRDLMKSTVSKEELAHCDAVVINPPRNGAQPQTHAIAQARVPQVVMISCNPVTCERDVRSLFAAGYRLTAAQAVDQFTMSEHVEVALAFSISA